MRFLVLFFIFTLPLFAEDYFYTVVDDIFISKDFKTYRKATFDDYLDTRKVDQFSIKILLNKKKLKNKRFYLSVVSDVDSLVESNVKYSRHKNILVIELNDKSSDELYFNYKYKTPKKIEFRFDVINEFEYKYFLHNEGILYGLAYGIIFCAFLYYIIIYFSTFQRAFLYYSLMQLSVLLALCGFAYVSFLSYPNQEYKHTQAMIDLFETLGFLFTLLFTKEILDTRKTLFIMNKILNIFIILNILDILAIYYYEYSILYEYMAFEIGFLIPILTGMMAVYKKVNYAIVYTLGWFIMLLFVYVADQNIISISSIYIIHIAVPLESLVFSFALGLMLKKLVNEQNEKEKLLIHKNKLASMGEMINNIAHQWRQPLTHISYINMNLQFSIDDEILDKKYIAQKLEESNGQIDFMSSTIDSFRDFYKISKVKDTFPLSRSVKKSIEIMSPLLKNNAIELKYNIIEDTELYSYENEYSQVVLNLITNAKDQLLKEKISNPIIFVETTRIGTRSITTVCDNAKGIDEKNMDKIFEPYFTTKGTGTGIGLYMSKMILESHFNGEITVENKNDGACFKVIV